MPSSSEPRPALTPTRRPGCPRDARADVAILEATWAEVAGVRGLVALSLDKVAARAGVSKATIYRRWPSKEALVIDVWRKAEGKAMACPDTGTLRGDLFATSTSSSSTSPTSRSTRRRRRRSRWLRGQSPELEQQFQEFMAEERQPLRTLLENGRRARGELRLRRGGGDGAAARRRPVPHHRDARAARGSRAPRPRRWPTRAMHISDRPAPAVPAAACLEEAHRTIRPWLTAADRCLSLLITAPAPEGSGFVRTIGGSKPRAFQPPMVRTTPKAGGSRCPRKVRCRGCRSGRPGSPRTPGGSRPWCSSRTGHSGRRAPRSARRSARSPRPRPTHWGPRRA